MVRVLIVDDCHLVRAGMRHLLKSNLVCEVVGEADSIDAALPQIESSKPDLSLIDLDLPGIGGFETVRRVRRSFPALPLIVVTGKEDSPMAATLLKMGVRGLVSKHCSEAHLTDAIREVASESTYIAPRIAQNLAVARAQGTSVSGKLTNREMQVLGLVARGHTTREICDVLCLSPKTVSTYRRSLHEKFSVSTDVMLVHAARASGL